jgi:hypothetical protein
VKLLLAPAAAGSKLAARRAGTKLASNEIPTNKVATIAKVAGSVALMPNSKLDINQVNPNAPISPRQAPIKAKRAA